MKIADLFAALSIKTDDASLKRADRVLDGVKTSLRRVVAAAGVATAGMAAMVTQTAHAADEYSKLSRKVGISVEGLQQLEFASKISGTELAVLRTGLQRFARTADDAGQGLKTAQEPFQRLHVQFKDSEGSLRTQEELLMDMADAFAAMPDGTEKTALAMKTFGRSGAELIPLLNEGSAGIAKLRSEFAATGAQISTKDAQAFEEYNDTVFRVKTAIIGFRNQAVIALLPHIQSLSKAALAWVKANRGLIKHRLTEVMGGLVKVLKVFGKVIVFLIKHAKAMTLGFIAWRTAVIGLAIATKLAKYESVAAALASAKAWVVAALPIVLITALIFALFLVLEDLYQFLTGGRSVIGEVFGFIVDSWGESITEFFDWLEDKAVAAAKAVRDAFTDSLDFLGGSVFEAGKKALRKKGYVNPEAVNSALAIQGFVSGTPRGPAPPTERLGSSGFRPSEQNVVVNVSGAGDPAAVGNEVARAIQREARSIKRATP